VIAELASVSFPALGTTALLCVTDVAGLPTAQLELERELAEIDASCSRFRDDSELVRLNSMSGAGPVAVSDLLLEAVEVAVAASASTGGLVDPTVGRTLRLAGYDRRFEQVRLREGASFSPSFASVPGARVVRLDRAARTIALEHGVELDLGATAKALAADRSAQAAARASQAGVLVSLGGDVSVAGQAPQGGWPVLVADDHATPLDEPGLTVAIESGGLATSGTVTRRWHAGGLDLHHVIDPRTGRPADTPWRTVTVAARSCVEANVASTAALVLGAQAGSWLASRGLPARLVSQSGEVELVGAWPEDEA
jgi:thiamine biosynthesis lipoprotein